MNPQINDLHAYPFEKLAQLFKGINPASNLPAIALSIGEPKHASPAFVKQAIIDNLAHLSSYPTTKGIPALSESIAQWLQQRFNLSTINPTTNVIPVNGTREALFSFTQAVIDSSATATVKPLVVMPNPFYQIYEGATLLAGATPYFVNCTKDNQFLGDFDSIPADVWRQTQLVFVCTPGNPTGAVMPEAQLQKLITLSDRYNFVIASDECYSELYYSTPPIGLLEVCSRMGRNDYRNCVVFHSLSKRSNLPGLRSGFVAGDATIMQQYLRYRTYHGAAMPVQHQIASIAAWQDETHVALNRQLYQAKFNAFQTQLAGILPLQLPNAGFYYWLAVDNDETFAQQLYQQQHIVVLPGRYLSRECNGINPGVGYVRMALVADMDQCQNAIMRIQDFMHTHSPAQ